MVNYFVVKQNLLNRVNIGIIGDVEMAKNTHQAKEAGKESGESLPHVEESHVKDGKEEEKEREERYVIQVSPQIEGEEGWLSIKKEGKIFVFSSRQNAEESLNRVMSKHPEMVRGRVMRIEKRGDSSILIPEMEINGKEVIERNREILPPEMREYVDPQMVEMMDDEEISGIRSLIADLIRKKSEIERFSRIAVQRSSFLKKEEKVKEMQKLKNRWEKAKKRLENAKKEYEKTREAIEDFIGKTSAEFPELQSWLRVSITGEGSLPSPNRGQGRRRSPEGKKGIILKFLQEHRGQRFKEAEIIKGIKESGMGRDYSWKQQTVNPRIRSMLAEGLIAQDETGRYYLP